MSVSRSELELRHRMLTYKLALEEILETDDSSLVRIIAEEALGVDQELPQPQ